MRNDYYKDCCSWMYADKDNRKHLPIGGSAYVITPDGNNIYESYYWGYGEFGGNDIYELVVDWNREFIGKIFEDIWKPSRFVSFSTTEYAEAIMMSDDCAFSFLKQYFNPDNSYLNHWKREVGQLMTCCDSSNAKLPFPIKITYSDDYSYSDLPASKIDIDKGFELNIKCLQNMHIIAQLQAAKQI